MRAGLMGDERHAQHARRFLADIVDRSDDLHAAALAATAGMDLRLHHPDRTAELLGRRHRFVDGERGNAAGRGHAETAEDFFGLIFMDVHGVVLARKPLTDLGNFEHWNAVSPRTIPASGIRTSGATAHPNAPHEARSYSEKATPVGHRIGPFAIGFGLRNRGQGRTLEFPAIRR